ncbi:hypothetical protein OG203_13385 [Nocardia sp. NBC_01499]|uniref:hypothetical protein n=1 Tax=Nocardia sp. NBC_01499 TaxID=2903597 RepID=UPI00386CA9E2
MDLDSISACAKELAARFDVRPPHIEAGFVPKWLPDGVHPLLRRRQPVVVIGTGFGDSLSAAEQEGALASAVVGLELAWAGRQKFALTVGLVGAVAILFLIGVTGGPNWQSIVAATVAYAVWSVVATVVRSRRIAYEVDRRVAEVMGRPFLDLMFELDARQRSQRRSLAGKIVNLRVPSEARRAKRLDANS